MDVINEKSWITYFNYKGIKPNEDTRPEFTDKFIEQLIDRGYHLIDSDRLTDTELIKLLDYSNTNKILNCVYTMGPIPNKMKCRYVKITNKIPLCEFLIDFDISGNKIIIEDLLKSNSYFMHMLRRLNIILDEHILSELMIIYYSHIDNKENLFAVKLLIAVYIKLQDNYNDISYLNTSIFILSTRLNVNMYKINSLKKLIKSYDQIPPDGYTRAEVFLAYFINIKETKSGTYFNKLFFMRYDFEILFLMNTFKKISTFIKTYDELSEELQYDVAKHIIKDHA